MSDTAGKTIYRAPSKRRAIFGVIGAIGLAWVSASVNVSASLGRKSPSAVLGLRPNDARANLRVAALRLTRDSAPPEAIDLARKAIARDASLPLAYVILAMDPRYSQQRRADALAYSRSLSRRDQGTTLLLLQDALRRGQIQSFFSHFDIAMRTSTRAAETFSPVVIQAMADDRVVKQLGDLLGRNPAWGRSFLLAAINRAPTAGKAAQLVDSAMASGVKVDPSYLVILVNRLLGEKNYAKAWEVYGKVAPDRKSLNMRPLRATPGNLTTGFDWVLTNDPDLWAQVEGKSAQPLLQYFANTGAGGVAARQIMILPSGSYSLRFTSTSRGGPSFKSEWIVTCLNTNEIGRVSAAQSGALDISVESGCPAVELRLQVAADLNVAENEGSIQNLVFVQKQKAPVRRARLN